MSIFGKITQTHCVPHPRLSKYQMVQTLCVEEGNSRGGIDRGREPSDFGDEQVYMTVLSPIRY